MGFDFSAVTALLGGYSERSVTVDSDRDRRSRRERHEAKARDDEPALEAAPRPDGSQVTGGGAGTVNGIGRALDALISAEETRKRMSPGSPLKSTNDFTPLSAALEPSLPKQPLVSATIAGGQNGRAAPLPREVERDWDAIRGLIEALAKADRKPADAPAVAALEDRVMDAGFAPQEAKADDPVVVGPSPHVPPVAQVAPADEPSATTEVEVRPWRPSATG